MKKAILIVLGLVLLTSLGYASSDSRFPSNQVSNTKQNAQKFKVSYTIVYNEQTLEEAARMEEIIKGKFNDACTIKIKASELSELDEVLILPSTTWGSFLSGESIIGEVIK